MKRSKITFSNSSRPKPQLVNTSTREKRDYIETQIPHDKEYEIYGDNVVCKYITLLHSTTEPAIQYSNGNWFWYKYGVLHRDDGPAVHTFGTYQWYQNGQPIDDPTNK